MSNVQETQEDPGLIIVYGDDLTIHNALGQAGAPVQQGQTAADSAQALREYVYSVVLSAPIDEDGQVVKKAVIPGGPSFSNHYSTGWRRQNNSMSGETICYGQLHYDAVVGFSICPSCTTIGHCCQGLWWCRSGAGEHDSGSIWRWHIPHLIVADPTTSHTLYSLLCFVEEIHSSSTKNCLWWGGKS